MSVSGGVCFTKKKSTNERTGFGAVGEASAEGCLRRDHHFPGKGTGKGLEVRIYGQVMWSALCFKINLAAYGEQTGAWEAMAKLGDC